MAVTVVTKSGQFTAGVAGKNLLLRRYQGNLAEDIIFRRNSGCKDWN